MDVHLRHIGQALLTVAIAAAPEAAGAQILGHAVPGLPATLATPDAGSATAPAPAQSAAPERRTARPYGRISLYNNAWMLHAPDVESTALNEVVTSASYHLVDRQDDGVEFGVDLRHSGFTSGERRSRTSIYEGFVGLRLREGALRMRAGHLWLNDLGSLGSVAGVMVEAGQPATSTTRWGRVRAGAFGGWEPRLYETGYAANVHKFGGYVSLDGRGSRRHIVGLVRVQNESLTERSALVITNFVPMGPRVFLYQAAEYDVQRPAGQAHTGWNYVFGNLRVSPGRRLDLQLTLSRGRAVDARGLSQDLLAGRPVTARSVEGLKYQSFGGRATVEVLTGTRAYAGYTRDTDNRGEPGADRWLFGVYASDLMRSGFDVTASETLNVRASGRSHSRFVSVGRGIGHRAYLSVDYNTSLYVVSFLRNDGLLIESRPETTRVGASAVLTLTRLVSVLATVDRTSDGDTDDTRVTAGVTYRVR